MGTKRKPIDISEVVKEKGALIKISGAGLGIPGGAAYASAGAEHIVNQIVEAVVRHDTRIAIVVGGGNIWRGSFSKAFGLESSTSASDSIGIYATIMNAKLISLLLEKELGKEKVSCLLTTSIDNEERYSHEKALRVLDEHKILVLGGGVSVTGFSTDFAAVNRAASLGLGAVLMAKNGTDGVYNKDPKEEGAKKYKTLSYREYISRDLKVADTLAVVQAREKHIPLYFFDFAAEGIIKDIIIGKYVGGTLVADVPTKFAE